VKFRSFIENGAFRGYYAAGSGNFVPTFWDNPSAPFSGVLEMGPIGYAETSVKITSARCVIVQKNTVLIYFTAEALTQKLIDIPKQKTAQQLKKSRTSKNENTGNVRLSGQNRTKVFWQDFKACAAV
jgi:hypothetical protein